MMFPVINKFLNLFMQFGRHREYFSLSFHPETKQINRMFSSCLTSFAGWLSTGAAGQTNRAFHKVRKLAEKLFLARKYIHKFAYVCLQPYSITQDICLSRGLGKFFNFYLGCQGKCWVFKRKALGSPAIVLGGG